MPLPASFFQTGIALLLSIALIVWLTAKLHWPAFFALLLACLLVGLVIGMPATILVSAMQEGFGNIMKSLGFIIVLGTALGVLLEQNGATRVLSDAVLKVTGPGKAAWAMSLTGFIVGMPIFCDSGFIVLSGVNDSVARKAGLPMIISSACLATGLYSVHCLMPPHPGVTAAAALLGVDLGRQTWTGIIVAFPTMIAGHLYVAWAGRHFPAASTASGEPAEVPLPAPDLWTAVLPVVCPILLIAARSLLAFDEKGSGFPARLLNNWGQPVFALLTGIILAILFQGRKGIKSLPATLTQAVEKAGGILVIIGAGGAFGNLLATTRIGGRLGEVLPLASLGLLFPFLLTALLKTAQGSSTVAIVTAASLVQPLLPALGLAAGNGPLLTVLAMGAGSFVFSHANDAYFWVISRFGGTDTPSMLKIYTPASGIMGIVALAMVYLLKRWLP